MFCSYSSAVPNFGAGACFPSDATNTLDSRAQIIGLRFPVTTILSVRRFAQIAKSIVGSVHVDVIDLMFRPASVSESPSNPVSAMRHEVYVDMTVSVSVFAERASDGAGWNWLVAGSAMSINAPT